MGFFMRATAESHQIAQATGINVKLVFGVTWGIAAFVAAMAGILLGSRLGLGVGSTPLVAFKAFPAIIFGGLESIPGAIIGGLVVGILENLAGGLIATLPSQYDLESEKVGHLVKKYFSGIENIPTEYRIKIARLIESMTGGTALVESMHGAGSPQAQRIMIFREGDLINKRTLAKKLAGIPIKKKCCRKVQIFRARSYQE